MSVTEQLSPSLPYLRRYARALTGSQTSGDSYVRAALSALLSSEQSLDKTLEPRVALYKIFHAIWLGTAGKESTVTPQPATREEHLRQLSPLPRAALLLTAVESFSLAETAAILGASEEEVSKAIIDAQKSIEDELASKIMIIEDEPVIALDLASLVKELGHDVVSVVNSHAEAVKQARLKLPDLILADINLGTGGSGLEAVREILKDFDVPVVFVTAYPEALLSGERPEPTYLIVKPFLADSIQVIVSQALFFHPAKRKAS